MNDLKLDDDIKKLFYLKEKIDQTEGKKEDVKKLHYIIYYRIKKSKPINNKISDEILKEIENYFCKDIKENEKYNLINQPVIKYKQRTRKKLKVNNSTDQNILILTTSM